MERYTYNVQVLWIYIQDCVYLNIVTVQCPIDFHCKHCLASSYKQVAKARNKLVCNPENSYKSELYKLHRVIYNT